MARRLPVIAAAVWGMVALLGGCSAEPGEPGRRTPPPTAQPDRPAAPSVLRKAPSAEETEAAASVRSPAIGKVAPDFTLPNQWDDPVTLSKLRGKWVVLYFYPSDDTPGCTCQATEFTDLVLRFDQLGATVLGVSPDSSAMHRYFVNEHRLNLTLLSDPEKKVMREYGGWVDVPTGPAAPGHVDRCTYLIDPTGKIAWHWPEVIPQGHAERVRAKLQELKAKRSAD